MYLASGNWKVDDNLNNLHSNLQDEYIANTYVAVFFLQRRNLAISNPSILTTHAVNF